MGLHVIHLVTAAVHSVNTYRDACLDSSLIMLHAIATLLECVLKIYVGMAHHVILTIIVAANQNVTLH